MDRIINCVASRIIKRFGKSVLFELLWSIHCSREIVPDETISTTILTFLAAECMSHYQTIVNQKTRILTTNLAACVCVCAKCDPFLPVRFHFFKRPENFVRIAKFPYAAFGPLFAFHCPIFFTKNNTLNGVCMLNVTAAH